MKSTTITSAIIILVSSLAFGIFSGQHVKAQSNETNDCTGIGLAPMFFKSYKYAEGKFDFNALPIFIDYHGTGIVGKRFATHLYLTRTKGESISFRNAGIEYAMPIYLYRSDNDLDIQHKAYLSPGALVLLRMKDDYINGQVSLYVEPGYTLILMEEIGINIGIQIGKSYNFREFSGGSWGNYLAIKIAYLRILGV